MKEIWSVVTAVPGIVYAVGMFGVAISVLYYYVRNADIAADEAEEGEIE